MSISYKVLQGSYHVPASSPARIELSRLALSSAESMLTKVFTESVVFPSVRTS
jgi:hypothetical protein